MQVQSIQNNNTTFGSTYRISLKSGTRKEELKKMAVSEDFHKRYPYIHKLLDKYCK